MADITEICEKIDGICGDLCPATFKKWVLEALCCIAQGTNGEPVEPVPQIDCEVTSFCNGDTGTVWCKKICFIDGVEQPQVDVDSGIVCPPVLPVPKVNYICNATTGLYDEVLQLCDPETGAIIDEIIEATTTRCLPTSCTVSTYCNELTDTWWCKKLCVIDNVEVPSPDVDTGVACDIEVLAKLFVRCNGDTGFYEEVLQICDPETGLPIQPEVVTPTTTTCVEAQKYDYELGEFCFTHTVDGETVCESRPMLTAVPCDVAPADVVPGMVSEIRFEAGFAALFDEANYVDFSDSSCKRDDCQKQLIECKKKEFYFGLENTGLRYNFFYDVELVLKNGETRVVTLPSASNWGPQMAAWATALEAAFPEACEVANHWWEWRPAFLPNTGAGAVPAADMSFPAAFGQFIQHTFCPTDCGFMPVSATVVDTDHPNRLGYELIVATDESDVEYLTYCVSCDEDCVSDEIPKCCIPVGEEFPELPSATCDFQIISDGCDNLVTPDTDPENPPEKVPVLASVTNCDGELTFSYGTLDVDGNWEDYTLVGNLVDCETGEPINVPSPKPEGEIVATDDICIEFAAAVIDNNAGVPGSTSPIYRFNNTIDFETTLVNGTAFAWNQAPTSGWSAQFADAGGWTDISKADSFLSAYAVAIGFTAADVVALGNDAYEIGGCVKVQIGCGQTGCGGFPGMHPDVAAAGLIAFWRHLSIIACDEDLLPATTEVTANSDPSGGNASVGHVQDDQPTAVTTKLKKVTVCSDPLTGALEDFFIDACGELIDAATLPPCKCWGVCPIALPDDILNECEFCTGNRIFQTATTVDYDITGVTLAGEDISGKFDFSFPIDGNSFATLVPFKDQLVACLEANGYSVTYIQGRDGWTLLWDGAPVVIEQTNGDQDSAAAAVCETDKSVRVGFDNCTKAFLESINQDCAGCQPRVETDAVCNDEEQTVDAVVIGIGQPIIRKTVTYFEQQGCECIELATETRFFNFNDPAQEFTVAVDFTSVCDFEADTVTRCDANGNEIQVTTLVVNTPDGGVTQTTFADANGDPIPEPLLPLSICNPQIQVVKGCVQNADGSIEYGTLHVQYDNIGRPGYDISYFTSNSGATGQLGTRKFICKPGPTENCPLVQDEYCYDVSGFAFACPTSTIEINSQVIDLCGGETSIIPSSGDLCTVGGVRSNTTGDRCRTNYPEPTTDPAGLATELQNFGSFGDELVNTSVAPFSTTNFYMAVRGTFPSLVGTTAPTIDLTTTWEVGSGISIHAYDCSTGLDLPLVSGTPNTYGPDAACSDGTRGPIDSWGNANNGMTQTSTWDTSGVADLGNVIFWSIVLNPPGDAIKDVMVNGLTPGGSCDVTNITTLTQILAEVTGTPWTINGNIICTKTTDELGALTCGTVAALPTVTDCTVDRDVQLVKVCQDEPCPDLVKVEYCVQSKGSIKTVKSVKAVKSIRTLAKTSEATSRVKESESKPGKILPMCEIRRYVCGEYDYSTFFYQGKEVDQATFDKFGLSIVDCSTPDASYTAGAVTCATEERFVEGVLTQVVLNCAVFTNDSDPTDVFTQYTLADSYAGIGDIGDLYQEVGTPVACPPGSITEQCDCFEAVAAIKGVANAGDTVEQCAVSNAIAGTTFYTITHTGSLAVIYTGTDPVADAGIDFGNAAEWTGPVACQPAVIAVGDEIPVGYECVDGLPHLMIAIRDAEGLIIGDRSIESTVVGLCDCCDEKCAADHCIRANLFDSTNSIPDAGDTDTFQLLIDGVVQTTVVHDFTTTTDGINKSSWYTPIVAAVNALPGWSMTLISDSPVGGSSRPTYEITYSGSTPQTLRITKAGSNDWTEYVADGAGNMTGNWSWSPDSTPFVACP